jgi:hypothetical protein
LVGGTPLVVHFHFNQLSIPASDPEDNEKKYIVTEIDSAGNTLNDFILVISDQSLKEKNTETGR